MANCQAHLRWVTKAVKKDPLMPLSQCFHIAEVLETTKKNAMHTFFNVIQKSTILWVVFEWVGTKLNV